MNNSLKMAVVLPLITPLASLSARAADAVTHSPHESEEQIVVLGTQLLFVAKNMSVPQPEMLAQAGVHVLAFDANAMSALTRRVQQTADALGPDAQERAHRYQRYFDRNAALVRERLKDLPASERVSVYHSMGNPLTDAIMASPQWASVDAVVHHRVYTNPKGMFWWCRETSEEALQFLWLAKILYPARFADVDMAKETRDFYRDFFDLSLSDAQIAAILTPPR